MKTRVHPTTTPLFFTRPPFRYRFLIRHSTRGHHPSRLTAEHTKHTNQVPSDMPKVRLTPRRRGLGWVATASISPRCRMMYDADDSSRLKERYGGPRHGVGVADHGRPSPLSHILLRTPPHRCVVPSPLPRYPSTFSLLAVPLQGGKNRRRGKNEDDLNKRELIFKEDGQGEWLRRGSKRNGWRIFWAVAGLGGACRLAAAVILGMSSRVPPPGARCLKLA